VCSTTGNGDPPNNAEEFWRFIRKRTNPKDLAAHLRFCMLALGDSNYDKFCYAGKTVHKRLSELGATDFYRIGLCDEVAGLESTVDPWIRSLWPALDTLFGRSHGASAAAAAGAGGGGGAAAAAAAVPAAVAAATPATAAAPAAAAAAAAPAAVPAVTTTITPSDTAEAGGEAHSRMGVLASLSSKRAEAFEAAAERRRHESVDAGVVVTSSINAIAAAVVAAEDAVRRRSRGASVADVVDVVHDALAHMHLTTGGNDAILEAAALSAGAAVAAAVPASAPTPSRPAAAVAAPVAVTAPAAVEVAAPRTVEEGSSAGAAAAPTPGVRTLAALFPDCAPPAADAPATIKGLPKLPPVTLEVNVLPPGTTAAAAAAAATSSPIVAPTDSSRSSSSTAAVPPPLRVPQSPPRPGATPAASPPGAAAGGAGFAAPPPVGRAAECPIQVPICNAKYLTAGGGDSTRRVIHMDIDVSGSALVGAWAPGDSIGIVAPNDGALVDRLCQRLGYAPDVRLAIRTVGTTAEGSSGGWLPAWLRATTGPNPTLYDVLRWCVDLTGAPKKAFLRLLAEYATGADRDALAWLAGRGGKTHFTAVVEEQRLHLLDLLAMFPSCRPPLAPLLSALPPLPPRFYSLASSPLVNPGIMSVAFTVVEYTCAASPATLAAAAAEGAAPSAAATAAAAAAGAAGGSVRAGGAPAAGAHTSPGGSPAPPGIERHGLATTWLEAECWPYLSGALPPRYPPPQAPAGCASPGGSGGASGRLPFTLSSLLASSSASLRAASGGGGSDSPSLPVGIATVGGGAAVAAAAAAAAAVGLPIDGSPPAVALIAPSPPPPAADDGSVASALAAAAAAATAVAAAAAAARAPQLHIFLRPARDFLLPAATETPLIMIGPGTGVAPFLGFLQHRASKVERDALNAVAVCTGGWRGGCRITTLTEDDEFHTPLQLGPAHLFFGNRRADLDYLYRDELLGYTTRGVLTRLHTAFSREGPTKVYVQHRMAEYGATLADLILRRDAAVYVCGDGGGMAKAVHATLIDILRTHGGAALASEAAAAEYVAAMTKRGRYVRDIWS